jgi:DNA-directed RNA polymerase subunit RPC12/RpoP
VLCEACWKEAFGGPLKVLPLIFLFPALTLFFTAIIVGSSSLVSFFGEQHPRELADIVVGGISGVMLLLFFLARPPLLSETVPQADSVYVKCLNCGAAHHYGADKVAPDRTVVCQNCNRTINLQGEPAEVQ